MKRVLRIAFLSACLVAACVAILGSRHIVLPSEGTLAAAGGGSLHNQHREYITALPSAEAVGMECMPQISVPHTSLWRTGGRVQQFRAGGAGSFTGTNSRSSATQRRTASGSFHIFGISSPVLCSFMKYYYIYMLHRILI